MVHVVEKAFTDASLANMHILCMNIIIALCTVTTVILFDILGETDVSLNFAHNAIVNIQFGLMNIFYHHLLGNRENPKLLESTIPHIATTCAS